MIFWFGEPLFEHHHRVMLNSQRRFGSPWVGVQGDPPNHGWGLEVPVCAYQAYVWLFCKGYTGNIPNYCTKDYNMVQYPLQGPAIPTDMLQVWIKIGVSQTWNLLPTKTHAHTLKKGPEWVPIISKPFDRKTCVCKMGKRCRELKQEDWRTAIFVASHSRSFHIIPNLLFVWLTWLIPSCAGWAHLHPAVENPCAQRT